ncbi:single-stranded DNA-binding protein [Paracoccus sp. DMF-8]|uniref:single-stranded DNA-binding protein n=1 Tax=Paracoccus sp. DMF-8 TaxID=3019445 RepID=UPI0023E83F11|nr:single-stranded DNA-binding protein [Paracoccus sp. DMF-8]MDF3606285.1 single-stranded DNA-binding protein [Paracoccus sp. DMF-8]
MKNITIAGRITRDAVTRTTQQGDKVTGFSVAVDDGYGQNKRTLYFDCSLWGKRGDSLSQYLTKGASVTVAGDLSTREHEGKTYLTIRVSEITLQGGKSGGSRDDDQRSGGYAGGTTGGVDDFDDTIPF